MYGGRDKKRKKLCSKAPGEKARSVAFSHLRKDIKKTGRKSRPVRKMIQNRLRYNNTREFAGDTLATGNRSAGVNDHFV